MYVIETPSGAHYGNCTIGSGETEKEAWLDAYGPKPWTPYVKKCAKGAWAREVSDPLEIEWLEHGRFPQGV